MSQATAERTEQKKAAAKDRRVWHYALTWDDLMAAIRGEAYTALCGKRCKGRTGTVRHRTQGTPIDTCVVCAELNEAR
jgi:hypothetical protein